MDYRFLRVAGLVIVPRQKIPRKRGLKMDLEDLFVGLSSSLVLAVVAFFMCVCYTLTGLLTGWVVSITPLGSFVEDGVLSMGFDVAGKLPAIGAAFGFFTGFIKGVITVEVKQGESKE